MNATQSIFSLRQSRASYHRRLTTIDLATKLGYVLSVVSWQALAKGDVHLYADSPGWKTLEACGLSKLWDTVDSTTIDDLKTNFTGTLEYPNGFWSAIKLEAWSKSLTVNGESASVDTDLWLLEDLDTYFGPRGRSFALHDEPLSRYLVKDQIPFGPEFPAIKLDWGAQPVNSSVLYLEPGPMRNQYFDLMRLFVANNHVLESLPAKHREMLAGWPTVYLEQHLSTQVAALHGQVIKPLLSWRSQGPTHLQLANTRGVFHLWLKKKDVESWSRSWWPPSRQRWTNYVKYWGKHLTAKHPEALKFFTKAERDVFSC